MDLSLSLCLSKLCKKGLQFYDLEVFTMAQSF